MAKKKKAQTKKKVPAKASARAESSKPKTPSKPKAKPAKPAAEPIAASGKPGVVTTVTHDQIAAKAYEIWLAKGRPLGQDAANWTEAEAAMKG